MSPKQPTSLREWGTRYDTLGSSSPSAPGSPTRSPPLPPSSSHTQNSITSVTPPTSANKQHFEGTTPTSIRPDKMPQDASIFVGSLPSNMDPGELGRALKDHLSDHLEAKSVKVVRDAKNRVCAFIQCEDAASAARLMETLQARPPGMFYGRHLRFEPARGFRTLLISYRIPTEWQTTDASDPREGHTIERPLNIAIRLYRPPGHRYITVLYDDKAESFLPSAPRNTHDDPTGAKEDVFGGEGVLFAPLSYDAEMIRQMSELFGPLEHFTPFTSDSVGPSERIYPHNSPRSSEMEDGVWEVKWRNRDDCVAAFATLRQIPHLSVTKMQRTTNDANHYGTPGYSTSPYHSPYSSPHRPRTTSYPYSPSTEYHRFGIMPLVYPLRPMLVPPRLTAEPGAADDLSSSPQKWTFAHSTPALRGPTSPLALIDGCAIDGQGQSPQWSETDFPPLHGFNGLMQHSARWIEPREIPEVDEHSEKATSDSPSSLSVQPATPVPPRESNSVGGEDTQGDSTNPDSHVQELTIPPTPEYSVSPLTPITPRTGSSFPRTPQSAYMRGPGVRVNDGSLVEVENANTITPRKGAYYGYHAHGGEEVCPAEERYLDPLTVFVGGLEMFGPHAWDEGRLWELFGKYGEVENVQLVKPPNKKSAFSFVRFRSAEASSRAVAAEHNRIHDGRQIRVQLRDTNHQRSPWKLMRGRGRINNFAPPPRLYSEMNGETYALSHPPPFHYSEQRNNTGDHGTDRTSPSTHGLSSVGSADSMVTADSATVFGDPSDPKALSSNHAESLRGGGQVDIQRSQSANTHPSASTTPSSMGYPPPTGPMPQYTMPPMGYFPPQWMHAYPSSYPYAVPFMPGYMGFTPPMPQGTNSGEVAAAMQPGYRPYPPPNGEYTQHHGYPPLVSHVGTQPPLRATGFIQGEHDTLIPVYQPEALTQYMSETSQNAPVPGRQNESRHPTPPAYPPTASAGSQPTPVWQPYPHMSMYPYVYHPPPMLPHHGQAPVGAAHPGPVYNGWAPTPYPVSQGSQMQGSQAPASHPPQLHLTPPPYGIPTPVSAQAPPHRLPPTSPRYPSQQAYGPQNSTPGAKRYSRRDGFAGNGGRPGNFNNRSLSQGNRPGARRSPNHDQGYQAMWRPNVHS